MRDFKHLHGTEHIDNEDGLAYKVIDIRRHRGRNRFSIVVDRKCSVGSTIDTVYALDADAMWSLCKVAGLNQMHSTESVVKRFVLIW